ncbi:endonuclease/exonuclease/phosphatase family protein [Urbifossiella limnaea]|uniref:Endonuclease/Exonuclease/phosphatase family protein n=1 Tax=Urbifossiella limnaea TaxID=2528023 RepID=A0A517XS61_9BACT|nr:endonuclease/exonuclease/phosphatase family protein [Urbifossiella limnaea]QDU20350.1 Endonuclease/Exonuclease/phosphatase family protein [Urbifossiella limnaea]
MSRRRNQKAAEAAFRTFLGLPTAGKVVVVVLALVVGAVALVVYSRRGGPSAEPPSTPAAVAPGAVAFMFWNVENLFDDRDDRRNSIDEPYDNWFAEDAAARRLKFDRLAEIILKQNGGNGPDVLACVEVESVRAAELLRDALNEKLPAGAAKYEHVAMKELAANAGRFMAPCVISKLPLERTKLLGTHNLRVLETHVVANGADLTLIASHWTSQLSDDGTHKGSGRNKYASVIRERYERDLTTKPDVDFLVCGDFNDDPESDAVANVLGVTADRAAVAAAARQAKLFGLLSGKPLDRFSTIYYDRDRKASIFDQVAVSPGLLDAVGWGCDPDSVAVPTAGMSRAGTVARRPWRFGDKNDKAVQRGYADHFPVTVTLKLLEQ